MKLFLGTLVAILFASPIVYAARADNAGAHAKFGESMLVLAPTIDEQDSARAQIEPIAIGKDIRILCSDDKINAMILSFVKGRHNELSGSSPDFGFSHYNSGQILITIGDGPGSRLIIQPSAGCVTIE